MKTGRIYTGDEISGEAIRCDVAVVGSGAGGSILAYELSARGLDVVLLEEGGYHTRAEFDLTEARAFQNLYQEMGNRTTHDLSIQILQGRSVGGGTTVNWCSCFRMPERILKLWKDLHGVEGLTLDVLAPHFEAVEKRLHIEEWPAERMNKNNRALWEGLGKLGYGRGLIRRNVNNCANLGYCGMGCPIDAKQSTAVTYIPDGVEKGLTVLANARVVSVQWSGRKAKGVRAQILDPRTDRPTGKTVNVSAKVVALCCGAINSPALLLRSELTGHGRVGKRLFLHPVVVMAALFDEKVEAFSGAPQAVYSQHFVDRGPDRIGFFIEVPPVHPMLAATMFPGGGAAHAALMEGLPYVQACIGLTVDGVMEDDEGGTVELWEGSDARLRVDYPLKEANFEAFREACREMARIQLAAGARQVFSLHSPPVVIEREADLARLDRAPWKPLRVRVVTAHQMGGCAMGKDPELSVVDSHLRYHGLDNLFVVDGSVFPTGLGVNPQETIFAMARWGSQYVAAAV